jgi:hypothetical protein
VSNGAHEVHGEIKRKYDVWQGGNGLLGLPQTDETGTPDGIGRFNHFDNGSIYWTNHTGPMTVSRDVAGSFSQGSGPIRDIWAVLGWERGFLGYPITDEYRWRTYDPNTYYFIAWNLFENGAIVTTKAMPGQAAPAATASITPEQLRYLVHRAVDTAVHKLPDNIGLYPDIETINISGYEGDFIRSKGRAITFKLHGFVDNGLVLPDTEFHFSFALRFSLSVDDMSFVDPWSRSLHAELIPGSVHIDIPPPIGWFVSGDDYKQKIEEGFRQHADVEKSLFNVTTYTPGMPPDQAKLVIIDIVTTPSGGIDFLVNPEPPFPGTSGSYAPVVQQRIDDFIDNY